MIVIALIAIAATVYMGMTMVSAKRRQAYVSSELPSMHYSAIQIICGNCSGEGEVPVKTFMDTHGNCAACGGHSYLLASHRGAYLRGLMGSAQATAPLEGRVVPFETRLKPRVSEAAEVSERIAV